MRHFLKYLLLVCILQSCAARYHYSTIDSVDKNLINTDNGFESTKEDVTMTFRINETGDVTLTIDNKTNEEFYVDWEKSFLITENSMTNAQKKETEITLCSFSYNGYENLKFPEGMLPVFFVESQKPLIVPVHSIVTRKVASILSMLKINYPENKLDRADFDGKVVNYKTFTINDTPLILNSYITLANDRNQSKIVYDNMFYVASFFTAKEYLSNGSFSLINNNTYHYKNPKKLKEEENVDSAISTAALVGLGLLRVILEDATSN